MSKIVASIAILCAISLALALPQYENDRKLTHFRTSSPIASRWELIGDPKPETLVQFSLALKQQNLDKLEEFFWRNSDPKSPFYAKHFTHDEVMHLVSPPKATQQKILHWLKYVAQKTSDMGGHVENIVNHGDSIMITANVIYIEELFKTKLHSFQNANNGKIVVKHLGGLSIPSDFADVIDLITGITEFPPTQVPLSDRMDTRRNVGDEDNLCNVPYTIKQLYNVPQDLWVTNANANVSIYAEESGGVEGFGFKSVLFWEQINGLPSNPIDCILGDGASNITPIDTDMEAQLDTQMVTGMAVNAKTCFWIIDGWMYDFTQNIFHTPTSPLVVSMSYGWLEWEQCDNDTDGVDFVGNCSALHIPNSAGYVNRTNIEFMKLGLIGHTMVSASGDDGTAGNHNSPDGCTKLAPVFPGASPYVLSVGATSIEPSSATSRKLPTAGQPPICTDSDYECPCSTSTNEQPAQGSNTAGFDSGGGFSVYTPRPSYQNSAVSSYLSSGAALPAASLGWNQNGRGYPDIGAVGENFCVVDPGESCNLVAGTSASAPLIASLITLLNNERLNAGKAPLGFVNPIIYDMFDTDSQKYFNNQFATGASNGGECGPQFGFAVQPGYWSPMVGVGSPKFDQILAYVKNLP